MEYHKAYIAENQPLVFYNGKALINLSLLFFYDDDTETIFDFPGYVSGYLRIYDSRQDVLIKNFTSQITRNSNVFIINASVTDMTFEDRGNYFFEMGYNNSGYEVPLRYGKLTVI